MYFSAMYRLCCIVDIARLVVVKQGWGGEKSYFEDKCVNISKTVGERVYSYC